MKKIIVVTGGAGFVGTNLIEYLLKKTNLRIISIAQDKDIILRGNDGGTYFNALTLDMSDAGTAYFNNKVGIGLTGTPQGHLDINTESAEATTVIINGEINQDKILKFRHHSNSEGAGDGYAGFIGSVVDNVLTLGHYNSSNTEVQALHVTEGGNVGIGTDSPSGKLDVHLGATGIIAEFRGADSDILQINSESDLIALDIRNTTNGLDFQVQGTSKMRMDASGNLLVGTDSGAAFNSSALIRAQGTDAYINLKSATTNSAGILFGDTDDNFVGGMIYNNNSNYLAFNSGNAERMRIDSSGNVLVGKTAANSATVGFEARADGRMFATASGSYSGMFNRTSSDGDILFFSKDDTAVGSIGVRGSTNLSIAFRTEANGDGCGLTGSASSTGAIIPCNGDLGAQDNHIDLGASGTRFQDIYATNGTIQTSDRNEKNTIVDSDLGLDFVKRLSPKSYKFNNKTRTHYGLVAQDIETVLSDISKSTSDFAGYIKDDISEEQDGSEHRYGLRYTEFVSPLIKAIQEQQTIIEDLKARIETLEG